MSDLNKVMLIGRLATDPELRYTTGGQPVADLRVATNRRFKAGNETKTEAQFHRVVVWGKQAEQCKEYLSKGRQIYLEGRLQTRSWEDKDKVKRYVTEIIAYQIQFLGSKPEEVESEDTASMDDMMGAV